LKDKYLSQVLAENEVNIDENNCIFNQLSFDLSKTPEENVNIAKEVMSADRLNFRKKVTPSYMDEIQHNTYGDMFRYYLNYNEGEFPTQSFKDLCYSYIVPSNPESEIEPYLEFSYKHTIEGTNVTDLDIDFIVEDVENTFGNLEDEKSFREFFEKEKELFKDLTYEGTETLTFKTASGIDVLVSSSYIQLNCGITIEASYMVEL
jgi:hypothetical protein